MQKDRQFLSSFLAYFSCEIRAGTSVDPTKVKQAYKVYTKDSISVDFVESLLQADFALNSWIRGSGANCFLARRLSETIVPRIANALES